MKDPSDFRIGQTIQFLRRKFRFHFVNSGSPHCVIFLDENKERRFDIEEINVYRLGREIRNHVFFSPEGANVNFVEETGCN